MMTLSSKMKINPEEKSISFTRNLVTVYETTGCHAREDRNF
jgi:hypothetical protein